MTTMISPNEKILIVDEDGKNRSFLHEFLEDMGYTCEEAENGADALKMLEGGDFRLVITDNQMPVMRGLELIENLHLRDSLKGIPTILLTGNLTGTDLQRARHAGVKEILVKPCTSRELAWAVINLSSRKEVKLNPPLASVAESINDDKHSIAVGNDTVRPWTVGGVWLIAVLLCLGLWMMISVVGEMILSTIL